MQIATGKYSKLQSGRSNPLGLRAHTYRTQRGQTLLEVALLTPLLLLLLLGVIEMGRYAYISILVGNAAHAGAAYGAQSLPQSACPLPGPCGIQLAAYKDFDPTSDAQNPPNITVSSVTSCGCDSAGTVAAAGCVTATNPTAGTCPGGGHWVVFVSVTASGKFNGLFNYPGIPSTITISRTATMVVAQN